MGKRVIVTGGSGKAGHHIIAYLLEQGHHILNLDLVPLQAFDGKVHTLQVDLTDAGQVFSAFMGHFKLSEPFHEPEVTALRPPDAVIHLAAYARNMMVPDTETFRVNTVGTYNVLEAACKLGVKKIVLSSSVCTYGVTYAEGDVDFVSFPVDEETDVNPMDAYAISKVCTERTGRGFARRYKGVDVYALRIGRVVTPEEYPWQFETYVREPEKWKVHGWSYIDARDLGQMCELCLQKDGLGFQIFNATNDEITNTTASSTREFLTNMYPNTPFTREMGVREAPMSNRKIKEMLGFQERHNWRQYYQVP